MNFIHVRITGIKVPVFVFGQNMQLTVQLCFKWPYDRADQDNIPYGTKTYEQDFFQGSFLQRYWFFAFTFTGRGGEFGPSLYALLSNQIIHYTGLYQKFYILKPVLCLKFEIL